MMIKHMRNGILAIAVALFAAPLFTFAAGESIMQFQSQMTLSDDGSFRVVETIDYDFGSAEKHGIYRTISTRPAQPADSFFTQRYLQFTDFSVTLDNGLEVPFDTAVAPDAVTVKIGDPTRTLTGKHRYVIAYTVLGGYSYFSDNSAEVYWNVTGNEWEVPIASAYATVYSHSAKFAGGASCYKGPLGSTERCDSIDAHASGTSVFGARSLKAHEGLTIAQSVDGASVKHVTVTRLNLLHIGVIVIPIALALFAFAIYKDKTKYKIDAPVIAQYEPYKGYKPMYTGVIYDGQLDSRDIAAGIVYLAQLGFLKIRFVEKKLLGIFESDDHELTLLRVVNEAPTDSLRQILTLLFSEADPVGTIVSMHALSSDQSRTRANYQTIQDLNKKLKEELEQDGFFEGRTTQKNYAWPTLVGLPVLVIFGIVLSTSQSMQLKDLLIIGFAVFTFIAALIAYMGYRRTTKGYEALNYLKGFKLFLSVTDKDRFEFHDAPEKSPELFMQYLPYAIAFGVEKKWAEVFKDIVIPAPDWYVGGNANAFSAVALSNSLGSFSSSLASSGASGSSGGGASGGGGGGGGGGSW